MSLNHILSEIFEILGVNKQMFISCGQDEPHRSPKKAYFSCVIGIYFLSFFYDHPVDTLFLLRIHTIYDIDPLYAIRKPQLRVKGRYM